jgi:hypothetical protein
MHKVLASNELSYRRISTSKRHDRDKTLYNRHVFMHNTWESTTGSCWQQQHSKSLIVFQYSNFRYRISERTQCNFNHIIKESSIHFEFLVVGYCSSNTQMTSGTKTFPDVNSLLEKGKIWAIALKLYSTMTRQWLTT